MTSFQTSDALARCLLAGPTLTHLWSAARSDLNNAVYMFEARLNALVAAEEAEGKPPFAFEVDYGERAEHCWNGKAQRVPMHLRCFCPREPAISRTIVAGR